MYKNKDPTTRMRWAPRPPKSYPKNCDCPGIPRKHGGYAHKIPIVWSSPKQKDQIIQRWDPVAKRLYNISCIKCKEPEYYPKVPSGWSHKTYTYTYGSTIRFLYPGTDLLDTLNRDVNPDTDGVSFITIAKQEDIVFPRIDYSMIEIFNTRTKTVLYNIQYDTLASDSFNDFFLFAVGSEDIIEEIHIHGFRIGDILKFTFMSPPS